MEKLHAIGLVEIHSYQLDAASPKKDPLYLSQQKWNIQDWKYHVGLKEKQIKSSNDVRSICWQDIIQNKGSYA